MSACSPDPKTDEDDESAWTTSRSVLGPQPTTIREAIGLLPTDQSCAYLLAQRRAPDLVAKESPENRFLATEDGDVAKAARRLASYWDSRVEFFGERAFLPLDRTGNGALDSFDIELFETFTLVNAPKDNLGRPVVAFCHQNYAPGHSDPKNHLARLRVAFYIFSVATEQPTAQSKGVALVASLVGKFRLNTMKRSIQMIRRSLPIRRLELHAMMLPSSLTFAGRVIWRAVDYFHRYMSDDAAPRVYRGNTDDETVQLVAEQGIPASVIPEWIGGTWTRRACREQQERRLDIERKRRMTAEEKLMERRRAEALRARLRRRTETVEVEELLQNKVRLENENSALRKESDRLQLLLSLAQIQVATAVSVMR